MESDRFLSEKLSIYFTSVDKRGIAEEIVNFFIRDAKTKHPEGYKGPRYAQVTNYVHKRLSKHDLREIKEVFYDMLIWKLVHTKDPKKIMENQHYALDHLFLP